MLVEDAAVRAGGVGGDDERRRRRARAVVLVADPDHDELRVPARERRAARRAAPRRPRARARAEPASRCCSSPEPQLPTRMFCWNWRDELGEARVGRARSSTTPSRASSGTRAPSGSSLPRRSGRRGRARRPSRRPAVHWLGRQRARERGRHHRAAVPGRAGRGGAVHADGVQQRGWIPATQVNVASRTWSVTQTWPPPQPCRVPRVHDGDVRAGGRRAAGVAPDAGGRGGRRRRRSTRSSPRSGSRSGCEPARGARRRSSSTIRRMKSRKLAASAACFGSIEGESSTTNRMSALEVFGSVTRTEPGWRRQLPTGVELVVVARARSPGRRAASARRLSGHAPG